MEKTRKLFIFRETGVTRKLVLPLKADCAQRAVCLQKETLMSATNTLALSVLMEENDPDVNSFPLKSE